MAGRRWWLGLTVICAVAAVIRVGYLLAIRNPIEIAGDPYQYHYGANLLVDGKGFIAAFPYFVQGRVVQSAQHPPLFTVVLAIPSLLGFRSFMDHQVWTCVIGTGTVALVGLVGRRLGGPRAGLIAAGLAGVYPVLWIHDGGVAAETLSLFVTALTLLAAYRLWDQPSIRTGAELGVASALAVLARAEALALLPFMVVPLVVAARQIQPRRRLAVAGTAVLATAVVLAPWAAFNSSRFDHPALVSTGFGLAMAQGNCESPYYGSTIGYYSFGCIPKLPTGGDETDDDIVLRKAALRYMSSHWQRVPFVVAARVGRTFGLYAPYQQIRIDAYVELRNKNVGRVGLDMYYVLCLLSVPGAVLLRRRKVPISPMLALVATVVLAVAVTFGQTRYRVSADLVPVLLTAVAVDEALRRWRTRRASAGTRRAVVGVVAVRHEESSDDCETGQRSTHHEQALGQRGDGQAVDGRRRTSPDPTDEQHQVDGQGGSDRCDARQQAPLEEHGSHDEGIGTAGATTDR